MKRLSKKIVSTGLAISMVFSTASLSIASSEADNFYIEKQITEIEEQATGISSEIIKEIYKIFKNQDELDKYGILDVEGGKVILGIKPGTLTKELEVKVEELKAKEYDALIIKEVSYTTDELIDISNKMYGLYRYFEGYDKEAMVEILVKTGQVRLSVGKMKAETKSILEKVFGDKLVIRIDSIYDKPTQSPKFNDVFKDSWYYENVIGLSKRGVISGYPDGSFKPDNYMTREEVCKVAHRVAKMAELQDKGNGKSKGEFKDKGNGKSKGEFKDVGKDRWSYNEVMFLKDNGIIKGRTETEFAPEALITREEVAVIADRLLGYAIELRPAIAYDASGFVDGSKVSDWAQYSVGFLAESNKENPIINGYEDGTFRPHNNITRGEMSKIMYKVFDNIETYYAQILIDSAGNN